MRGLLDPRNGPEWDLPRPPGPLRTLVLASTPRTGSTLLGRALAETGLCGVPTEWVNPMQLRDWAVRAGSRRHHLLRGPLLPLAARVGDPAIRAHLDTVRSARSAGGWFALKLHRHHFERWPALRAELADAVWVRVRRRDRLAQAVSWARALQTGRWASWQGLGLPPIYSRARIERCLRRIERDEAAWDAELGAALTLDYEDLAADLRGAVVRVLDHLRIPIPSDLVVRPSLERQADAISADWIRRYQAG